VLACALVAGVRGVRGGDGDFGPALNVDMGPGAPAFTVAIAASCAAPAAQTECDAYVLRFKLRSASRTWMAMGVAGSSAVNAMIGGHAVAGFVDPDHPAVGLYALNLPSKSQVVLVPGKLEANGIRDVAYTPGDKASTLEFTWDQHSGAKYLNLVPDARGGAVSPKNAVKLIFAQGGPNAVKFAYHEYRAVATINLLAGSSVTPELREMPAALVAHVTLAIVAFVFFMPAGALVAHMRPGSNWLAAHATLQTLGCTAVVVAWGCGVAHVRDSGGPEFNAAHEILGTVLALGASAQVVGGLVRRRIVRRHWLAAHRALGLLVLFGGAANVLLGADLFEARFLHGQKMFEVGDTAYSAAHFLSLVRLLAAVAIVALSAGVAYAALPKPVAWVRSANGGTLEPLLRQDGDEVPL